MTPKNEAVRRSEGEDDLEAIADGLALWDEHKPQSAEDWLAIASRMDANDYATPHASPLFAALRLAVQARDTNEMRATMAEEAVSSLTAAQQPADRASFAEQLAASKDKQYGSDVRPLRFKEFPQQPERPQPEGEDTKPLWVRATQYGEAIGHLAANGIEILPASPQPEHPQPEEYRVAVDFPLPDDPNLYVPATVVNQRLLAQRQRADEAERERDEARTEKNLQRGEAEIWQTRCYEARDNYNGVAHPLSQAEAKVRELEGAVSGLTTQYCREWDTTSADNCHARAEFILWGKLVPPEALGPRCYDHAAAHVGHDALKPGANFALIDLRPARQALAALNEKPEEEG